VEARTSKLLAAITGRGYAGNRHIIGKWAMAMSTARQAMENMEYVRGLLEEKQPGFAASVELALSLFHRQIECPEETMELTLPPERHEIIEKQDPVHEWRVARLARLGIPWPVAEAAAGHVDWHQMAALVQRGCPPWTALRILR
jgi:hypothetical protein